MNGTSEMWGHHNLAQPQQQSSQQPQAQQSQQQQQSQQPQHNQMPSMVSEMYKNNYQ